MIFAIAALVCVCSQPGTDAATSSSAAPEFDWIGASAPAIAPSTAPLLEKDPFGYTYVQLDYVYSDLDDVPGSQNGYDLIGSLGLIAGLYVQGNYSHGEGKADVETFRLGAGYHLPLFDKLDVFGLISYQHDYLKLNGSSGTGDGYELDIGARFMLTDSLEVNGQGEWNHVDDDNFGVAAGARYYFAGPLSIGAGVESIDSDFRFNAGARFTF